MSLTNDETVSSISAFVVHDPFLSFPSIYNQVFPSRIIAEALSTRAVQRFCSAVLGWISYMPLFLRITRSEKHGTLVELLERKSAAITSLSFELKDQLQCDDFLKMRQYFDYYCNRVEIDYTDWKTIDSVWRRKLLPMIRC